MRNVGDTVWVIASWGEIGQATILRPGYLVSRILSFVSWVQNGGG